MTTPQITRRGFLAATAVAAAARPATAAATTKPAPRHSTRSAARKRVTDVTDVTDVTTQQGNASVTAYLVPVQDVTAIEYTITNVGVLPDTFTVSTTDLNDGRQSRQLTFNLNPGESSSAEVFGRLNHSFQLNVCQSDGTCFTVGPLGPAAQSAGPARGLTARPMQPGPTP